MARCTCGRLVNSVDMPDGILCQDCYISWLIPATQRSAEANQLHPIEG